MEVISGGLLLTNVRTWKECGGFIKGETKISGSDNYYDESVRSLGYKTYVMEGVYIYHWYRGDGFCSGGYLPPLFSQWDKSDSYIIKGE